MVQGDKDIVLARFESLIGSPRLELTESFVMLLTVLPDAMSLFWMMLPVLEGALMSVLRAARMSIISWAGSERRRAFSVTSLLLLTSYCLY
jgi:hypothetical protein